MPVHSKLTDKELLALLKDGDERAFNTLYERYWEKLLYFAYQKTQDQGDAENVLQDVFVSLWNRRATLAIHSEFSSYLSVSVKYRILRLFDQRRSKRVSETDLAEIQIIDDSTQELLEFDELRTQLEKLIAVLPERSGLIFRLSKEENLSHREIAQRLGTTEKAINADLVRTKKSLLSALRSFMHSYFL